MPVQTSPTEADLWEMLIRPEGPMSKETARRLLELEFTDGERSRMHELAEKNRNGVLTEDEESLLDHYCRVGTLLATLKVRARRVLKHRSRKL